MEGRSSMFFNNFNNLGLVENRKKHESTGKKHFRDSLPDRQNGGFGEKKHEKHKKHPWLQKVAGASPDPHVWILTYRWGKCVFRVFRVSTVITYTYSMFFICFFIFFMCFYVFLPTYTPNHTKSLWIEIHSPSHGTSLGGLILGQRKLAPPKLPLPLSKAPGQPTWHTSMAYNGSTLTMASNRREKAPLHGRIGKLSWRGQGAPS